MLDVGRALHAWGDSGDEAILVVAEDGRVTWTSRAFTELLGYESTQVVGSTLEILTRSRYSRDHGDGTVELRKTRSTVNEVVAVRSDGSRLALDVVATPVSADGAPCWVVNLRSVQRAEGLEALRGSERRFRTLAERSPVATFFSGGGVRLEYVNDRFAELLGCRAEAVLGTGWLRNLPASTAEGLARIFERALQGEEAEDRLEVGQDGAVRQLLVRVEPVADGSGGAGFVGTAEDITERMAFEYQLAYQARHDALTGLPNRTALWELLTERLPSGTGDLALLFLDLDNFKLVNDSLGHDAGDELLVQLARRLEGTVRGGDLVTRFGGDEFLIVARGVGDETGAARFADRILEAVVAPVNLDGVEVHPSTSLGVALAQPHHKDPHDLVRDADIAMYKAKAAGKSRWELCDDETRRQQQDRLMLLADLRNGVENGEVEVAYQPVVSLPDQKVVAVEALLRWEHPERGTIAPTDFVKLAEENGLIARLGEFVLYESCRQMREWIDVLGEAAPRKVNVNVSMKQMNEKLPGLVSDALAQYDLPGERLCLEITETALMTDPCGAKRCLEALRELGVVLAVDDFGTGHSSLSYLRELPVSHLKVDKSFIDEIGTERDKAGVVAAAVIALAGSLGLDTVAEGVETAEQAETLTRMGCTYGQGYHFSRAVPGHEIVELLGGGQ